MTSQFPLERSPSRYTKSWTVFRKIRIKRNQKDAEILSTLTISFYCQDFERGERIEKRGTKEALLLRNFQTKIPK